MLFRSKKKPDRHTSDMSTPGDSSSVEQHRVNPQSSNEVDVSVASSNLTPSLDNQAKPSQTTKPHVVQQEKNSFYFNLLGLLKIRSESAHQVASSTREFDPTILSDHPQRNRGICNKIRNVLTCRNLFILLVVILYPILQMVYNAMYPTMDSEVKMSGAEQIGKMMGNFTGHIICKYADLPFICNEE